MEVRTSNDELFTVAFSSVICALITFVYLLIDFDEHQPLFFVFLGISFWILLAEHGEQFLTKVFGSHLTAKVIQDTSSTISKGHFLFGIQSEEKWTRFWAILGVFVSLLIIGRKMDDAALIYSACMLFSSSPIWKKLLGRSTREFTSKASKLFQPPPTETEELAEYMPELNEISQNLSLRIRRNSADSTATDFDISVFGEENFPSLDTSALSILNDSNFLPHSARSYGKSTDDDSSPIASDVEVVDAEDVPDSLTISSIQSGRIEKINIQSGKLEKIENIQSGKLEKINIQSGRLESDSVEYTPSGTLRRSLRIQKRSEKD